MENNNDQKWKLADVLANFTKSQLQKQQELAIREEMKQRMMDAQAQNLAQFVPGAQPAPQEQGFPQDFAMAKEGGIHIDPSKRGTFRAQATRMGMSVQEAARHILANKDKYSPKMVKKANFARNFAKEEGGEMFGMESMGGDDNDKKWWQFWKKDKPMTFEDKMKQELGILTKNLMEIEAAIVYYTQKGGVNQSSFDEGLNNYHNSYSNYIEQLKNTREKLLLEKSKIENAINGKTAEDKRKEEEIAQMKYDEARIKADKEAAKRKAEEESYLKHRQELKDQTNQKEYGGQLDEYKSGGYTVRRSNDRKGKTHVVIGPDGTKKYFGDPGMGERSKSKYGKEAFYKRHAQNLKDNPYFRAYARATWEEGGEIENEDYENEENENEDYEMVSGIADILQQVKDKENRRQIAENMIEDFEEEDVDYNLQKFMDMAKLKRGGEMIRRADGSYSQRGLWDNIRANKGSGKAPTKEMLAQERKIKKKRYDDGGTLPSCEEGYYWNPDTQSCEPIANYSNLNEDQKFLIKMANSPLFEERYNKMIGRKIIPMKNAYVNEYQIVPEVFGPEQMPAENFRKNIIENVSTVKYAPEGEGDFNKNVTGKYIAGLKRPEGQQFLENYNNHINSIGNSKFKKWLFKEDIAELEDEMNMLKDETHKIYISKSADSPYTKTHETSHASTLGDLFPAFPYSAKNRNPYKEFGKAYTNYHVSGYDAPESQQYLSEPTEIKARIDAARKYMMDKGLYDPINNRFTEKDFYNFLRITDESDIQDLKHNFSKEDIIRMFNEIVANNPKSEPVGKRGGQLGRFLL